MTNGKKSAIELFANSIAIELASCELGHRGHEQTIDNIIGHRNEYTQTLKTLRENATLRKRVSGVDPEQPKDYGGY